MKTIHLCLTALLAFACHPTPKPTTVSAITGNRNAALPDDAQIDPNKSPSTLVATFIRATNSAQLVWDRPISDIGADFHYEIYRATLDSGGAAQSSATQILTADNSVLEAIVAMPQVSAGQVVAFNVVVRTNSAARDSASAPIGQIGNAQHINPQPPEGMIAVTCGTAPSATTQGVTNLFTTSLASGTTTAAGSTVAFTSQSLYDPAYFYQVPAAPQWLPGSSRWPSDGVFTASADDTGGVEVTGIDATGIPASAPEANDQAVDLGRATQLLSVSDLPAGTYAEALASDAAGIVLVFTYAAGGGAFTAVQNAWVYDLASSTRVALDLGAFDKSDLHFTWVPGRAALLVVTGVDAAKHSLVASSFWFSDPTLFSATGPIAGTAAPALTLPSGFVPEDFSTGAPKAAIIDAVDTTVPNVVHTAFFPATRGDPVLDWVVAISPTQSSFANAGSYALTSQANGDVESFFGHSGPNEFDNGFAIRVSPDGKHLAAIGKQKSVASQNCLLVWPFGTDQILDAATFASCAGGKKFGGTYTTYSTIPFPGPLYDWMWVPTRFVDAGKDLILIGDKTTSPWTTTNYELYDASTGALSDPAILTSCTGDGTNPFELDLGFPLSSTGKSHMILGCATGMPNGDSVYQMSLTDFTTMGNTVSLNTNGRIFVPFANDHVLVGKDSGFAFLSGQTPPFSIGYVDASNGLTLTLSSIGTLDRVPDFVSPIFNQARDGHAGLLPDQLACSASNQSVSLSPAPALLLFENAGGGYSTTNTNLLAHLPNAPAGTPVVLASPDPVPDQDFYFFAVYFEAGASFDCSTGFTPANLRAYGIDMQTCKSGTCTIQDVTPNDWGCSADQTVREMLVSLDPYSFAKN